MKSDHFALDSPQCQPLGALRSAPFIHAEMMMPSLLRSRARSLLTENFAGSANSGEVVQVRPSSVLRRALLLSMHSTPPSAVVTKGP